MKSIKTTLRASVILLAAGTLAACGGGGDRSTPPPAPVATSTPPPVASFQSQFGTGFATVFNASATSDPIDPTTASVPPLAPASDPIDNPPG